MNVRQWFVFVVAVSAGALGWLTSSLLGQDKTVETQRRPERLEQAAGRDATLMQEALSDLDRNLTPGVLRIHVTRDRIETQPWGTDSMPKSYTSVTIVRNLAVHFASNLVAQEGN